MLRLLFLHIQVATTSSPSDAVCLATRPARTASVLRATYRRRHQRACSINLGNPCLSRPTRCDFATLRVTIRCRNCRACKQLCGRVVA